ncbi:GNAT family N-acetyltransferase [Vulcaniibacterium tengchongense]|uniref:Acetyltransferase (GNAT) family protein n=1 Tax=Vulcaniibacterium tengchongense TaxID=1273429 RepID=A0A3N4VLQ8_9GAMM|nr:GNAT family N-acetyltransferase [Vulcaniibacterium tengchongense]RPE80191.1 acetyltransferase (GNAT) family protein [Vulcaniibacterium tengchongense]
MSDPAAAAPIVLRTQLRPGDIGRVVLLHGELYAREHGYDHTFEAYVAEPLARFAQAGSPRERLWLVERDERVVGCIAIVEAAPEVAQLRWFLVDPNARGMGLGRRLIGEAIAFAREQGYRSIMLWTVEDLQAAAHLYRAAGFRRIARKPGRAWGVDVVEEQYELAPIPLADEARPGPAPA